MFSVVPVWFGTGCSSACSAVASGTNSDDRPAGHPKEAQNRRILEYMRQPLQLIGSIFLIVLPCASGQTGPTLVDVAYDRNVPYVAPGQIVRLHVSGLNVLPALSGGAFLKATSTPLPTALGGISVIIRQYYQKQLSDPATLLGPFYAPFLSVSQANLCFT